jgi:hypothetical protein
MWSKCSYIKENGFNVIACDIDESNPVNVVADFFNLPFANDSIDLLAYDPPHLPNDVSNNHIYKLRYGITSEGRGRDGDNVSGIFIPFMIQAKRVLKSGGVVAAKIIDIVHNHKKQWQSVDLILSGKEVGLTPDDMIVKIQRSRPMMSGKWKNQFHFRNNFSYWLVFKNKG